MTEVVLTAEQAQEIRDRSAKGETRPELAFEYGVSTRTISRVVDGEGAYKTSLVTSPTPTGPFNRVFTNEQAKEIRIQRQKERLTYGQLATRWGVSGHSIGEIIRGNSYKDAGGPIEVTKRRRFGSKKQTTMFTKNVEEKVEVPETNTSNGTDKAVEELLVREPFGFTKDAFGYGRVVSTTEFVRLDPVNGKWIMMTGTSKAKVVERKSFDSLTEAFSAAATTVLMSKKVGGRKAKSLQLKK